MPRGKTTKLTQPEWERRAKIIGGVVGAGALALIGRRIYKDYQDKKATGQHDKYITETGVNLTQTSINIHDAFYNYAFGMYEDEQQAIDALKRVPKKDIHQLALIYNKTYDKNLYEDFRQYLSNEQYSEVASLLE